MRAYLVSSKVLCEKPIENVFTGADEAWAIAETTIEESTPPERNAPSVTSEISRALVASKISSRRCTFASSYDSDVFCCQSARQYVSMTGAPLPAVQVNVDAGGRRCTPVK